MKLLKIIGSVLLLAAVSLGAVADGKTGYGSIAYTSSETFMVAIDDSVFLVNTQTEINGGSAGSETNLAALLGSFSPGESVMYVVSDSPTVAGVSVLVSLSEHAP